MKRIVTFVALVLFLVIPNVSFGAPIDFSGGVSNEYMYEEVIFITGEPIKFSGEIKVTERDRKDTNTISYRMDLEPSEEYRGEYEGARYRKNVTYVTESENHSDIGQTTAKTAVTRYNESLDIDGVKYDLKDYQFFKSDAIDNRAASDFYSGDITARKYYIVSGNGQDGTVTIDVSGTNSGYENFWGSTETQSIDHTITSKINSVTTENDGQTETGSIDLDSWTGTVSFKTSDSLTKNLRYSSNDAHHSSFEGGHVKVTNEEAVSKYNFRLPSGSGTIHLNAQNVPQLERLIVPKFRDVNGHWAEEYIKKLYSLDVFSGSSSIFSPDTPMNRLDFTKAIVKSCDIRGNDDGNKKPSRRPKEEAEFTDLPTSHPDYEYVKSAVEKGIIKGDQDVFGKRLFNPNRNLTRAEAVTILVRALGFENRAPNPGYVTSFADDAYIPGWAMDSIYMAKEMNLLVGDSENRANPGKELTRSEASSLLVRFLEFLEDDLQKDYRDNIVNFN